MPGCPKLARPNWDSGATPELWACQFTLVDWLEYGAKDTVGRCMLRLTDMGTFPFSRLCSMPSDYLDEEAGVSLAMSSL